MTEIERAVQMIYHSRLHRMQNRCELSLARIAWDLSDKQSLIDYVSASVALDNIIIQEGAARRAFGIARPCEG